jgi:hypothetical protein
MQYRCLSLLHKGRNVNQKCTCRLMRMVHAIATCRDIGDLYIWGSLLQLDGGESSSLAKAGHTAVRGLVSEGLTTAGHADHGDEGAAQLQGLPEYISARIHAHGQLAEHA